MLLKEHGISLSTRTINRILHAHGPMKSKKPKKKKNAIWLNMAEIEISARERQCLDRKIGDIENLGREMAAWVQPQSEARVTIHRQFTSQDVCQKLARSYPKIKKYA